MLKNLNLGEGEDAKMIIVDQIHMIPLYLRKMNDRVHAFIGESFGTCDNDKTERLIKDLKDQYKNPNIIVSSTPIQHDYFSCTSHSIKSIMYFAKHGASLFEEIDYPENMKSEQSGVKILKSDKLPAVFIKFAKAEADLEQHYPSQASQLVSRKRGLTLKDYHDSYHKEYQGKKFNTSPLIKKYHYVSQLEDILRELSIQAGRISANAAVPLPFSVEHIISDLTLPEQFRIKHKGTHLASSDATKPKQSYVAKIASPKPHNAAATLGSVVIF